MIDSKETEIIKCNNCGQVLISGRGCISGKKCTILFGPGTSLSCNKCGVTYTFGQKCVEKEGK